MKIAFAHYSATNDISGVTTWAESLLIALHRDKIPLVVLLIHFGGNLSDSRLYKKLNEAGVCVEIYSRSKTLREDINRTIAFLNQHKPTLFLPQCLNAFYFAAEVAGKNGLSWVLTMHSDDPDYWSIAEAVLPAKCNGKIVCVSGHLTSEVRRKFQLNDFPITIPYGVGVSQRKAEFSNRPYKVVYSGRVLERQKRISLIIETMILVCKANENIECIIIGGGAALGKVTREISANNLDGRVILKGVLTPQEVREELINCQSLLLMSDFEGLPVALLEAMAVGLVPVVREIPSGIPELVINEDTGLLVDDNPASAADAIVRLSQDPDLWKSCSTASIKLIESNYNAMDSYTKWKELVNKLNLNTKVNYPVVSMNFENEHVIDPIFNKVYNKHTPFIVRLLKKIIKRLF